MKHLFVVSALLCLFASCANHGKKVTVEGTKTEIFYKGDGVTESDAKKVGDLLKARFIQSNDKKASIQVTNENDAYTMRFVYDKEIYKTLKNVDNEFKALAVAASKEVFNGKKVNVALSDDHFKDWKTISWDEDFAKSNDRTGDDANPALNLNDLDHEAVGDVHFYWTKSMPDEESKRIADYIIQKGDFGGGTSQIIMSVENGRTIIRFPVKPEFISDAATLATIEGVAKDLKDNLFPSSPFSFQVLDPQMNTAKSWDY